MFSRFTQSKISRYLISGGTAAFVSLSLLYIFTDIFGIWYLLSSTFAFIFAFLVSFLLQKLWTFKDTHTHDISRQLSLYFITAIAGLFANALFMYVLVSIADLWFMLAQVFSSGAIAAVTFFVYGNIIFNHTQKGHVLIATGLYPPDIGGPATYSRLLETELPKHNIDVTIASFGSVRRLLKIIRHIAYFLKISFKGTEAEIFYALDPVSVGFPTLVASKLLRKKFILRIAGDYAWEQNQVESRKLKVESSSNEFVTLEEFQRKKFGFVTELRRKIQKLVARHADAIVVPSEYLKNIILHWGVNQEKITVIYNAFTPPSITLGKNEVREKLGVDGAILVSAGRFVPWKGFEILIDIVADLINEIPDLKLYIIGDGPEQEVLKLKVASCKLQEYVFLVGKLSHDELTQYVQAADMFILNTGYEGFSHQLLEAMALGTPIVTTKIGGNPELLENQKEGILVEYNKKEEIENAIKNLFQDDELRNVLSQNAKEKAKTFSKERAIESLIKLF